MIVGVGWATCLAGHNPTVVGAYFPWNILISFPEKSTRNPDIWIPGSRRAAANKISTGKM
jgi:hypothetical protein